MNEHDIAEDAEAFRSIEAAEEAEFRQIECRTIAEQAAVRIMKYIGLPELFVGLDKPDATIVAAIANIVRDAVEAYLGTDYE